MMHSPNIRTDLKVGHLCLVSMKSLIVPRLDLPTFQDFDRVSLDFGGNLSE